MHNESLWLASEQAKGKAATYPLLADEVSVEVAIIGGGITGLTTALQLNASGRSVAVLEGATIGSGTSGNSTGNLYAPVSERLYKIARKWGDTTMHQVVQARAQAVTFIEETVHQYGIDCGFSRQPWYLYAQAQEPDQRRMLQRELQAALDAGLPAALEDAAPLPFPTGPALRIDDQAQFNPYLYLKALAEVLRQKGVLLFENSPALEIDGRKGIVRTENGRLCASCIVEATHTPKGISLLHTELAPYREYGIAATLKHEADYPEGTFWQMGETRTLRSYQQGDRRYLVVIGEKHKTGQQHDGEQCFQRLVEFAQMNFPVTEVTNYWSAQGYFSADSLPYIGRAGSNPHYVASGYATDGLTYGTLAGLVLGNLIVGKSDPRAELFPPGRFTPAKSASSFTRENLDVGRQYLKDYLSGPEARQLEQIPDGEGRIMKLDGERLAVYRDRHGQVSAVSAVCTHMRCLVHWNNAEKTWDCPCHGSRFDVEGNVLEGPALKPLAQRPV